jgi:hypothetical protein
MERDMKLRQFIFNLTDLLPGTVRGLVLPSGKYLNVFAEYLNILLVMHTDFDKFKQEIDACQVPATDD